MNKQKPREFWIADDGNWNCCAYTSKRKFLLNSNTEEPTHVIEYSALQVVEQKLAKAVDCLKFISREYKKPGFSKMKRNIAYETLASLGESEVGEG